MEKEYFWFNFLTAVFIIAIPAFLIIIYYLLLKKINTILIKKYWFHIMFACLTILFYSWFEYNILYRKYLVNTPNYISEAVYGLSLLSIWVFIVLTIRGGVLLLLKLFKKKSSNADTKQ